MATILILEDAPDLGPREGPGLTAAGHRVVCCCAGLTPLCPCPLLRSGCCPDMAQADLIVFSCALSTSVRGRTFRGIHLLRALRSHADYGRLPLLIVSVGDPGPLGGSGPVEIVEQFAGASVVRDAIERLLRVATPRRDHVIDLRDGSRDRGRADAPYERTEVNTPALPTVVARE